MKGVRCSWVDMQKIRQQLEAADGEVQRLAKAKCITNGTLTNWRRTLEVIEAFEDKIQISVFENFQPSHAEILSRELKKRHGKAWTSNEDACEEARDWADKCEAGEWTVQEFRQRLRGDEGPIKFGSLFEAIDDLHFKVRERLERWEEDWLDAAPVQLRVLADKLHKEIENGRRRTRDRAAVADQNQA